MRRLPLRFRLGLVGLLVGVAFAGTVGWGQAEYARAAELKEGGAPAGDKAGVQTGDNSGAKAGGKAGAQTGSKPGTQSGGKAAQTGAKTAANADAQSDARGPGAGGLRVQIEAGDTLFGIAKGYGVDLGALLKANKGVNPEALQPGQELALPAMAFGLSPDLQRYQGLFGWPLEAPLTSPFGPRWGRFHAGIDFAADEGTAIRASRAGKVTTAGNLKDYGLAVVITHPDGTRTLYGHCSALRVQEGDKVKAGQIVAEVGSTGLSTGPHLHFEIRVEDEPRDPLLFLTR